MFRDFDGDVSAISGARSFVIETAPRLVGGGHAWDDAALVACELVTNAVRAGTRQVRVELAGVGDALFIGVTDDAGGHPEIQSPPPTHERGRGLQIVAAVADRWGVREHGFGKQVWATVGPG